MICLYCLWSVFPSIRCKSPTPLAVKQPHTFIYTSCFTVPFKQKCLYLSFGYRHTRVRPAYRKRKGLSLLQSTFFHCSIVQLTYFFAQSSHSFLFFLLIKFFFNVKQELNPHSLGRFRMVCLHTAKLSSSLISFALIAQFILTDLMIFRSSRSLLFLFLPLL